MSNIGKRWWNVMGGSTASSSTRCARPAFIAGLHAPSRRPWREHVTFFAAPDEAAGGRVSPMPALPAGSGTPDEPNVTLIQEVCAYLTESHEATPTLEELGTRFGLSPYHLQRTFKRIVGVTPRQYAAEQRVARFKGELKNGQRVTDALYNAGFQSSSAAYAETAGQFGMTPAEYQRGGDSAQIAYTIAPCSLGWLLLAATERGICAVRLGDSEAELAQTLAEEFPAGRSAARRPAWRCGSARCSHTWTASRRAWSCRWMCGRRPSSVACGQALTAIPYGSTRSYGDVAAAIGQPAAACVGRAGVRHESGGVGDPLPPRHSRKRRSRRVSLGPGAASRHCWRRRRARPRR